MANQAKQPPKPVAIIRIIFLATMLIVLPGMEWSLLGWMHLFLPLTAFFVLGHYGDYTGKRLLLTALALALLFYLLQSNIELFVFAAGLLITGYIIFLSAQRQDPPAVSWLKGSLGLAGCWIVIVTMFSLGSDISPYGALVKSLNEGFDEALTYYQHSDDVSGDTLMILETSLQQMKVVIPLILPSILGSFILVITWGTMALGNLLLLKKSGQAPWSRCRFWQLPEKLIWFFIGATILALLPSQLLRPIGVNGLILLCLVYSLQGLSIAIFYMEKWKVPLLLRSFFYVMMIFQSFGTLLLLIFGIADIWFDFRNLKRQTIT